MTEHGPEVLSALVWWVLVLITVIIVGAAVLAALMLAWRNYNRRQGLLDKGRALRAQFRGDVPKPRPTAWQASADRIDPASLTRQNDECETGDDESPPRR